MVILEMKEGTPMVAKAWCGPEGRSKATGKMEGEKSSNYEALTDSDTEASHFTPIVSALLIILFKI